MIAPAFLIKILGCATVGAFLTIGIPVMVNNAKEAAAEAKRQEEASQTRQAEIDQPETILQFFANLVSGSEISVIHEGETFSDEAIETWLLTTDENKTTIVNNWNNIIPKMPIKFFEKHISQTGKPTFSAPNTCYLKMFYSKEPISLKDGHAPRNAPITYIPFPKTEVTYKTDTLISTDEGFKNSSAATGIIMVPMDEKHLWDDDLLQTNPTKTFKQNSQGAHADKKTYEEILFLEQLYKETSKRLDNLGFHKSDIGIFWAYDSSDCSTDQ